MKKLSIRNAKVKNKLLMFSGLALLIIVVIAIAGIWILTLVNQARIKRYDVYGERMLAVSDTFTYFNQIKIDTRNMMYIYDDVENQDKREQSINNIDAGFESIEGEYEIFEVYLDEYPQEVQDSFAELKDCIQEYSGVVDQIVDFIQKNDMQGAEDVLMGVGMVAADQAQGVLETLMDGMKNAAEEESDKINYEVTALTVILIIVCALSFVFVIVYCTSLTKQIAIPVAQLSEASRKMAMGDINVDCHKINDDDLGQLMEEFERMADATRDQTKVMDSVSRGDLTVAVTPRSDRDVIGTALHRLVADNNRYLGDIKESSGQVTIGAEQVANASQSLAQGSTEQASALQQITASMAEIADKTKVNASQANEADTLVRDVKGRAADGNEQMKTMIEAMNDINQSSEMISKIIKTIDDISFQTNILALNAAVEAARAGVHGKGFAVVAEEVRNLAAKSASAASETAEMIEDSIQKVSNGAKIAEETGKSLDEIVTAIDKIVELIGNIAVASNDQATAVSQIDQAIGQVSTVVQTNSATSEECAAASEELSNQAANLRKLLGNYQLASDNNALPGGSSHALPGGGGAGLPQNDQPADFYGSEPVLSLDGEFGKY